jgi:DNA-binding CsgD family transcriptional regulator/tetratricopeptide (TPR) repeat protein
MRPGRAFVGRQRELDVLGGALESAPAIVWITGDAGIGKSRLAREVMTMARARGFVGHDVACFPHDASIAYAPFRQLIRRADNPALDAVLTYDPKRLSPADVDERRRDTFVAWRRWLETSASGRPLCLCIEDLHWCDEVSLTLLADIALRPLEVPCVLLVTFRDEASPLLSAWRTAVDRSRSVVEVALGPLTAIESTELLLRLLEGKPTPTDDAVHELCELAEGNPFFLEELAKAAEPDARQWRLPRSISDATTSRLEGLEGRTRDLLALAAVEGRDFDAGFLGRVLGTDEPELSHRLHALIDANFIVERSTERFSFRHALLRVVVLERLLARERRELHSRIARALVDAHSSDVDALARHWFGAEAWDEALPVGLAAAEAAFALYAFRSAKDHWTRTLEAAARLGRELSPAVHRSLGLACELLEEFEASRHAYQTSLELAQQRGDALSEWQALVALGRLWTRRDYVRAGVYFERARATAARIEETLVQAESATAMGSWLLNTGRDAEAVSMHASVLPLLDAESHVRARAQALDRLGMANGLAGRHSASVEAYNEAIELFRRLDDPRALATSLQGRAVFGSTLLAETVSWSGRSSSDCLADAMESVRLCEGVRVPSDEAFGRMGLACVHAARDEIGPSLAEADACHAIAKGAGHHEWSVGGRFIGALALLRIFAAEEARDALRALLPAAEVTGSVWWSRNTRAYLALAYVQCHDLAGAQTVLDSAPPSLGSAAERRLEWARAELALLRRDAKAARAIVDRLLEQRPGDPAVPIPQLLLLQGSALVLERHHAAAIRALERARDVATASGGIALTLRIHAALSAACVASGRRDDATSRMSELRDELLARAAEVGREEVCRTGIDRVLSPPGRVALRRREADRFGGLTRREREIAALLGKGGTNAEIAAALCVSARTIETHVENIRAKLRVKSRVEIAVWAARNLDDASRTKDP